MQCKLEKHKLKAMKFFKTIALIFLLLNSLHFPLSANSADNSTIKGVTLSNTIYNSLKQNKYSPLTQALINNGENAFPYNVYLNLEAKTPADKNLILIFSQEQVISHNNLVLQILDYITSEELNCNIIVLFSYGDKQFIEKRIMLYGSEIFINSLNSNEDYTAIIIDLDNQQNKVITSSNGYIAPSYLIQNEYNIYLEENLKNNLPLYYVSQIYNMKFFQDRELETILKNEIPGIKLCLNKTASEDNKAFNIIKNSILKFNSTENTVWEQHFLLFNFFGTYYNFSESLIIKIIITIFFVWLIYIFLLGFINIKVRNYTWNKLKKIWYSIPLTFGLALISFYSGRGIFSLFFTRLSGLSSIYYCITLQLCISTLLVTLLYLTILLLNYNFSENSLDFLIVTATFINQAVFILADISLFPLFMLIFLLAILAYYVKNNPIHIFIFILMILALIPYCKTVITNGQANQIQNNILKSPITPVTVSLAIYPIYLLYLRILTSVRNYIKKRENFILFTITSGLVLMISFIVFANIRVHQLNNSYKTNTTYKIVESTDEKISLKYTDKYIFTDIIRTIEIDLEDTPEVCDVRINSAGTTPVLYSDNDYEEITQNSVIFKIPENPPEHLTFSYGAAKESCNIVVSALYPLKKDSHEYAMVTKVISIGDN